MRRIAPRSEIIQKRKKRIIYKTGIIPNRVKESGEIEKNNRITLLTDFYVDKRWERDIFLWQKSKSFFLERILVSLLDTSDTITERNWS